jgi:hypothetical protein
VQQDQSFRQERKTVENQLLVVGRDTARWDLRMGSDAAAAFFCRLLRDRGFGGERSVSGELPNGSFSSTLRMGAGRLDGTVGGSIWEPVFWGA